MSGSTSIVDATPPFVPGTFDGRDVRLATLGQAVPGLFARGDLAVVQRAAGANMSVDIGAGRCFVDPGYTLGGVYLPYRTTTYNTLSDGGYTWTAADPTNARIDLLCVEVSDADFGGSYTGWKFRIVDGTPSASATSVLLSQFWPTVPAGCVPLAAIRIPATATTITTANILNLNAVGGTGNNSLFIATEETTTSAVYTHLATPDVISFYLPSTSSSIRISSTLQQKQTNAANTVSLRLGLCSPGVALAFLTIIDFNGAAASVQATATANVSTLYGLAYSTNGGTFYVHQPGVANDAIEGTLLEHNADFVRELTIGNLAAGWYFLLMQTAVSAGTLSTKNRRYRWELIP